NDAPTLAAGQAIQVQEGGGHVLSVQDLQAGDVDDELGSLVFELEAGPWSGRLEHDALPGQAITAFTGADLIGGRIRYVHDGSETGADHLLLRVRDAARATSAAVRLDVLVTAVDDQAPTLLSNGGQAQVTIEQAENAGWSVVLQAGDADSPIAQLRWRIAGGADAALFRIDEVRGELSLMFVPDREQPRDADRDNRYEVVIEVSDGVQAATQQIALRITDLDEAPVLRVGSLQVDQGRSVRIDASLVQAEDVDTAEAALVYRVVSIENGRFVTATQGMTLSSFTQADVRAGRVLFVQDENALAARIRLALSDGHNGSVEFTLEVRVRERDFDPDAGLLALPRVSGDMSVGGMLAGPSAEAIRSPGPSQSSGAETEVAPEGLLQAAMQRVGRGAGLPEAAELALPESRPDREAELPMRRARPMAAEPAVHADSDQEPLRFARAFWTEGDRPDLLRLSADDLLMLIGVPIDLSGFASTALIRLIGDAPVAHADLSIDGARVTPQEETGGSWAWSSGAVSRAGAVVFSAGALFWAARAAGLAASLSLASPVWWRLDPLPVLRQGGRTDPVSALPQGAGEAGGQVGDLADLAEDLLDRQG
ncbi:MAG: hypothetical protein RLZZ592_2376, partial [Pseudomonadota bacterium]